MAFHQYSKIAGHSLNWSDHYRKVDEWAVTEKVHGSNFSFILFRDGTIKYAKRTSEIKEGERFFHFETILNSTIPKIQELFPLIQADRPTLTQIQVYGELFGGIFPSEETYKSGNIKCVSHGIPVQKGIYYSPDIHFIAFDIHVACEATEEVEEITHYLHFRDSLDYFKRVGLFHVEPLAVFNTYEEALEFDYHFTSTIPEKLGLSIPAGCNILNKAEGVVIRSMTGRYLVKRKIPEFSETAVYSDNKLNKEDTKALAFAMLTENRLNNAISKVGGLEENRNEIYDLLVEDVIDELNLSLADTKNWRKLLKKEIFTRFGY